MKFSIKYFFSKCDQIRRKLKKSLMENLIFCAVISKLNLPVTIHHLTKRGNGFYTIYLFEVTNTKYPTQEKVKLFVYKLNCCYFACDCDKTM